MRTGPAASALVLVALTLAAPALTGCSRPKLAEFGANVRDRVSSDWNIARARALLRPSPAEYGGDGGRVRRKSPAAPQDPNAAPTVGPDGAPLPPGGAPANTNPPPIYYFPSAPTPAAPSAPSTPSQ